MSVIESLKEHLDSFTTAPILFVGSGFSRRYLGLENWSSMLEKFSLKTTKPYKQYLSSANSLLPQVASLIAQEFHSIWWESEEYNISREQNSNFCDYEESPLKIEISEYLKTIPLSEEPSLLRDEIEELKNAEIDGIITTNWDNLLENIFPDFKVFIGQDAILFNHNQEIGEIYKIHGCCSDPNSLILTSRDYEGFNKKNPYLTAKLLTFFIEHPIIFIGYSLSDSNINSILHSIAMCLTTETVTKLQDRLIFVEWDENFETPDFGNSILVKNEVNIPIKVIKTKSFLPVYETLATFKRRYNVSLLRKLKEHVYDLIASTNPHNKILVLDMDDSTNLQDVDFVIGVGIAKSLHHKGYTPITRIDLLRDIIFDNGDFDANEIVNSTLPLILRSGVKFVPCFKYLKKAGYLNGVDTENLCPKLIERMQVDITFFQPRNLYTVDKLNAIASISEGITELETELGPSGVLKYGTFVPIEQVDDEILEQFLQNNFETLHNDTRYQSSFYKLICYFDFLKYGLP